MYKKIVLAIYLLTLFVIPVDIVYANSCELEIEYVKNPIRYPWESEKLKKTKPYKLEEGETKKVDRKHMRKINNYGDLDVSIEYWTGGVGNEKSTVKRGEKKKKSGDLKKIKCIKEKSITVNSNEKESSLQASTSGLWDADKAIHVCWKNPSTNNTKEREWVKSAIRTTWEKHSKLMFYGWGRCKNDIPEIIIQVKDTHPNSIIGKPRALGKTTMQLNFTFKNWTSAGCKTDPKFCIKAIAVHEFGHALGFVHEQNRIDARNPLNNSCGEKDGGGGSGNYSVTPYDLHSIMNYCNPKWNGDGKLSEKDIEGLHKLYGFSYDFDDAFYSIKSMSSNKCLDVKRSNKHNGAKIIEYDCKKTTNQIWKLREVFPNYYEIIAKHSGKCLDVRGSSNANGAKIIQYECNQTTNQLWKIAQASSSYDYNIKPYHSGKCLDSPIFGGFFSSKEMIQYECNNSTNQEWKLTQSR